MNQKLKLIKINFIEIFSNIKYLFLAIFMFLIMGLFFSYFANLKLNIGNLGISFVIFEIFLEILISFLFAIFVSSSIYKLNKFTSFSLKENTSGAVGSFLGILVVGCPACSITFASYIGLAGIVSLIPGYGLGLKLIGIPFLIYSNYFILKDLNICKLK